MSAAHSPAPWFVAAHTAESPDEITPGCDWTVYGADKVSVCFEGAYNKHANANVRLITAAPDLLEALQYAIKQVPELATVPGIAAAIAKATGDAA